MDLTKKLSILIVLFCFLISLKNQLAKTVSRSVLEDQPARRNLGGDESPHSDAGDRKRLLYDFYRTSCPSAEKIVRSTVRELHEMKNTLGPQLLRLAFHDCFVMVDAIKSRLEQECPGVVSCADIVVLAGREAVLLAGGQFYPVLTGRMDSKMAFPQNALDELPSPKLDIAGALRSFAAKGFDARETVALLGINRIMS